MTGLQRSMEAPIYDPHASSTDGYQRTHSSKNLFSQEPQDSWRESSYMQDWIYSRFAFFTSSATTLNLSSSSAKRKALFEMSSAISSMIFLNSRTASSLTCFAFTFKNALQVKKLNSALVNRITQSLQLS